MGCCCRTIKKVISYIKTLDNKIGKGTKAAVDALKAAAKNEKILEYAYKSVDFASKMLTRLYVFLQE